MKRERRPHLDADGIVRNPLYPEYFALAQEVSPEIFDVVLAHLELKGVPNRLANYMATAAANSATARLQAEKKNK